MSASQSIFKNFTEIFDEEKIQVHESEEKIRSIEITTLKTEFQEDTAFTTSLKVAIDEGCYNIRIADDKIATRFGLDRFNFIHVLYLSLHQIAAAQYADKLSTQESQKLRNARLLIITMDLFKQLLIPLKTPTFWGQLDSGSLDGDFSHSINDKITQHILKIYQYLEGLPSLTLSDDTIQLLSTIIKEKSPVLQRLVLREQPKAKSIKNQDVPTERTTATTTTTPSSTTATTTTLLSTVTPSSSTTAALSTLSTTEEVNSDEKKSTPPAVSSLTPSTTQASLFASEEKKPRIFDWALCELLFAENRKITKDDKLRGTIQRVTVCFDKYDAKYTYSTGVGYNHLGQRNDYEFLMTDTDYQKVIKNIQTGFDRIEEKDSNNIGRIITEELRGMPALALLQPTFVNGSTHDRPTPDQLSDLYRKHHLIVFTVFDIILNAKNNYVEQIISAIDAIRKLSTRRDVLDEFCDSFIAKISKKLEQGKKLQFK